MSFSVFRKTKLFRLLTNFIKQGTSPEKLALTVALGITIGAFPVIGPTTLLCTLAALLFRVNLAGIQLVNYTTYPIQIITILPFYKLGAYLFGDATFNTPLEEFTTMFRQDIWGSILLFGNAIVHAIVAWCLVAPIAGVVLYLSVLFLFKKFSGKKQAI
jgi:uncharacterized protein (DUF2062 family)